MIITTDAARELDRITRITPTMREWACLFVFEVARRSVRLLRVDLTASGTGGRWRSVG